MSQKALELSSFLEPTRGKMLTTLGERAAASVEREFPLQLRTIRSKETFKNSYKTFFVKNHFSSGSILYNRPQLYCKLLYLYWLTF